MGYPRRDCGRRRHSSGVRRSVFGGKAQRRVPRRFSIEPLEDRALMTCIVQPTYLVFHAKTLESAATSGSLHAASVSSLSTAAPTGLAPAQIRTAYGINLITSGGIQGNGSGQTIAIVDAYDAPNLLDSTDPGFDTSDLHQFDAQFGLPDPPSFRKVGQDGSANLAPASGSSGWSVESSLDVEWAHAVAPGANIVLVEANDASLTSIMAAIDTARNLPGVSVVSMSFGTGEIRRRDCLRLHLHDPGRSYGRDLCRVDGRRRAPGEYPAYSPNVLAVGGTTLDLSANGGYGRETGWSGSGGGQSTQESEPTYQGRGAVFRLAPDPRRVLRRRSGVGRSRVRFLRLRQHVALDSSRRHERVGALLERRSLRWPISCAPRRTGPPWTEPRSP